MTLTSDLKDFGYRELKLAAQLLNTYCEQAPEFLGDGVHLVLNRQSGYVFLSDDEFNVGMMNGDKLDAWLFTPYEGYEGFLDELISDYDPADWHEEDLEYICQWAELLNVDLPENWRINDAA